MAEEQRPQILSRMLRNAARLERQRASVASQLRFAARQAAAQAGLAVIPVATQMRRVEADQLIRELDRASLVIGLRVAGELRGVCTLDPQLATSLREVQTRGIVGAAQGEARDYTSADGVFVTPFLIALLRELQDFDGEMPLDDLARSCEPGGIVAEQALAVAFGKSAVIHGEISVAIEGSAREGRVGFAFRDTQEPEKDGTKNQDHWQRHLAENVYAARTPLRAILTRLPMSLRATQSFATGDVIALNGVRVTGVRLETGDGALVAQGRLGQAAGLRALRIERPAVPELSETLVALPQGSVTAPREVNMPR